MIVRWGDASFSHLVFPLGHPVIYLTVNITTTYLVYLSLFYEGIHQNGHNDSSVLFKSVLCDSENVHILLVYIATS